MSIINIAKAGTSVEFDFDAAPDHVRAYIINYGLTQCLNDAAASVSVKDLTGADLEKAKASALGLVQKRLDNLKAGTLRASSGRTSDPVAREAKALGTTAVIRAFAKKGLKPADAAKHKDFSSLVAEYASRASTLEQAKAIVALATVEDIEVDL